MTGPKRASGPLPGLLSALDRYSFKGALGAWLERVWFVSSAHGWELVAAFPRGVALFPADADRAIEELERAGWVKRATREPHPTRDQRFFGVAEWHIERKGMFEHLPPTWWAWEPVRSCEPFAAWALARYEASVQARARDALRVAV